MIRRLTEPVRAALKGRNTTRGGRVTPLVIVATIVVAIAALYWAQAVLIPFALAVLLTFLLSPIINALQRAGLGRLPSVAIVVSLTLTLLITIGWITVSQVRSLGVHSGWSRTPSGTCRDCDIGGASWMNALLRVPAFEVWSSTRRAWNWSLHGTPISKGQQETKEEGPLTEIVALRLAR